MFISSSRFQQDSSKIPARFQQGLLKKNQTSSFLPSCPWLFLLASQSRKWGNAPRLHFAGMNPTWSVRALCQDRQGYSIFIFIFCMCMPPMQSAHLINSPSRGTRALYCVGIGWKTNTMLRGRHYYYYNFHQSIGFACMLPSPV